MFHRTVHLPSTLLPSIPHRPANVYSIRRGAGPVLSKKFVLADKIAGTSPGQAWYSSGRRV